MIRRKNEVPMNFEDNTSFRYPQNLTARIARCRMGFTPKEQALHEECSRLENRLDELKGMIAGLAELVVLETVPSSDYVSEMAAYADYVTPHICDEAGE